MTVKNRERRTFLEIIASILDACQYGIRKTHVMQQCNLNFMHYKGYLDLLLEANLLLIESAHANDREYSLLRVTDKGRDFLKSYNNMRTLIKLP